MKQALKLFLLLVALAFPTATQAGQSCRLPHGRVVDSGRVAKLVAIPTPHGSALFACIRRTGRKIPLDTSFTEARVAGRWVTWQRARRFGQWRIAVRDLRTGRGRQVDGHVAAHSLALTIRGTIAWAQKQESSTATPLYANDAKTGGHLLDGGAVDARSVHLRGRRVSWLSGGVQRAATVR